MPWTTIFFKVTLSNIININSIESEIVHLVRSIPLAKLSIVNIENYDTKFP